MSCVIATWNVNSVRARLELVVRWLKMATPDVILLQETKVEDAQFPREPLEDLGFNVCTFGQKSYNGVAILSKSPIEDVTRGLPHWEEGASEARYIEAFTCGVRVASIYVPNGQDLDHPRFAVKGRFFEALHCHTKTLLTQDINACEAFILGGDFNVAPFESDVYDPAVWSNRILCSDPERRWMRSLVNLGLYDPLQASLTRAKTNPFTWWDYRTRGFGDDRGLRIDHLLLSPKAANRFEGAHVDKETRGWERPSDHAPVVCRLKSS